MEKNYIILGENVENQPKETFLYKALLFQLFIGRGRNVTNIQYWKAKRREKKVFELASVEEMNYYDKRAAENKFQSHGAECTAIIVSIIKFPHAIAMEKCT